MASEFELMKKAKELFDKGMSINEISKEVFHDELWVAKSVDIMKKLPTQALKFYEKGKMSRPAAEALANLGDKAEQVFKKALEAWKQDNPEE